MVARDRIVVAGSVAQKPGFAGHAWVFLQYLLGFSRLGFDVMFVDWIGGETTAGRLQDSEHARWLAEVMEGAGLETSYALLDSEGGSVAGLERAEVLSRARSSLFLLNVMGYLQDDEVLAAFGRRVF